MSHRHSPSTDGLRTAHVGMGSPAPGVYPPAVEEPYFLLPTQHFSIHHHLRFNPRPEGPQCNCGTWQMWCLPPHLGGCGHIYVQDELHCGLTIEEEQPANAVATACPDVFIHRPIKCAGWMMGLCPTCRQETVVVQTYNNFIAPFFVPKGLAPMKTMDAEEMAAATWRAHRLAFAAWVAKNRKEHTME